MSLNALSSHYPWLLTHPIFWTARHLSLVECQFEVLETGASSVPEPLSGKDEESNGETEVFPDARGESRDYFAQLAEIFAKTRALPYKTCTLINLLVNETSGFKKAQ